MLSKNDNSLAAIVQNLAKNLLKTKHICDICLKGYNQKFQLDNHLLNHFGNKCDMCEKHFSKTKHLKRHINSFHPRLFICDICQKEFASKERLSRHAVVHIALKPFSCSYCKKTFNTKGHLNQHLQLSCTELPEGEITSEGYLANSSIIISPNRRKYICDSCKKKFKTKLGLKNHMIFHGNVKIPRCPICEKQIANLYIHLKIHSGKKSHSCSVCSRKFIQKADLHRHEMSHSGEKPFSCGQCKSKFTRRSGLKRHMGLHSGEKPFSCAHCLKQFSRKHHVVDHMKRTGRGGTFICSTCRKLCLTKCSLLKHAEVHVNRNHDTRDQFTCSTCLKRFSSKSKLIKHLKIHQNTPLELKEIEVNVINMKSRFLVVVCEQLCLREIGEHVTYICPICEKMFHAKFLLTRHAKSHIFEEQLTCLTCHKDFDDKNTLNSHLEVHFKKETTISSKSESKENEKPNSIKRSENESYFDVDMKQELEDDDLFLPFGTAACNLNDNSFIKEEALIS